MSNYQWINVIIRPGSEVPRTWREESARPANRLAEMTLVTSEKERKWPPYKKVNKPYVCAVVGPSGKVAGL
jgi:hypothetical protein